jgi:uncharacterized protein
MMIGKLILCATLVFTTTITPPLHARSPKNVPAETALKLNALIAEHRACFPDIPGEALTVVTPQWCWSGVTGFADGKSTPMTVNHAFRTASVTKPYTAAAILRPMEMGKLDIAQPIATLISDTSAAALRKGGYDPGTITVQQLLALATPLAVSPTQARTTPPTTVALPADSAIGDYVGQEVMIPMRDGAKLHAQIWRPKNAKSPLPLLMQRSPYGFDLEQVRHSFDGEFKELAAEGYIFVLQDIRGRFGSEGAFVNLRPKASGTETIDESTDTYDSIEWLTRSIAGNNGKVGVFGISYDGWTAAMAAINPHPALAALSVQASPEDMLIGDDFHHNGAFRIDYAWEWVAALETDGRTIRPFDFGKDDPYAWFLKQNDLATLDKAHIGRALPSWQDFVAHSNYDAFWRKRVTSAQMPKKVAIPNLNVGGWWDQEDFYGTLKIYENQEKGDKKNRNFLVIGPWNHGGWASGDGSAYGPFDMGSATSAHFRSEVQAEWFAHWLKGKGKLDQPEALIFQTGSNTWKRHSQWPPVEGVTQKQLYLRAGGKLSFDPPGKAEDAPDRFVSDPADPVPYRTRPISPFIAKGSTWSNWLADDQAPFTQRKDVLFWQTDPLKADVTITGRIAAKLFASTTGSDADWVVKLVDIYPSDDTTPQALRGRQRMIANDVFRGRFRASFEKPQAIPANSVLDYSIDLHAASHRFKKGHRIGVHIQSSWFPLINRNPQVFVDNILKASPSGFKAQTHSVFHSNRYPSAITVAVEDEAKQ